MTISTILAIVFGWLFINNWLAIIFVKMTGDFFSSWDDYFWLFVMSVFTPFPFLLLYLFYKLKKKFKNWKLFWKGA